MRSVMPSKAIFAVMIFMFAPVAPAAAANLCDDLWLSRNEIFDNAGFCFRSTLGQSLFDNAGCRNQTPAFSEIQQDNIAAIVQTETQFACEVDTRRGALNIDALAVRKRLTYQPVAKPDGVTCRGYIGPDQTMRAAPDGAGRNLGAMISGETLAFQHEDVAGWVYVRKVSDDEGAPSGGWIREMPTVCEAWSDLDWQP